MNKLLKMTSIGALVLLFLIFVSYAIWLHTFPKDLIAELKNNQSVYLTSATISGYYNGEPRSVSLNEAETLRYLTKTFRDAGGDFNGGSGYFINLRLNNGIESDLMLTDPKDGKTLTITVEEPFPSDGKDYGVKLVEPIPKELKDALFRMENK